jgi:hypothetical protein
MKNPSTLTALAIGLALTGPAYAAPSPDAQTLPPPGDRVGAGESWSADNPDERVVTGRVLKVDADEGMLLIQTPMGVLALRGPREGLRDVSVGDVVQVEMVAEEAPSASPPMDEDETR